MAFDKLVDSAKLEMEMTATAVAIRNKTGLSDTIPWEDNTGFANAVSSAAVEFKAEGIILGTCVKMFTIAGPVIACGTSASIAYGLILLLLD